MKKNSDEIREILKAGGSIILDAKDYNTEIIKGFSKLLLNNKMIIKNASIIPTSTLKEIVKISPSNIVLEL